ncbi:hypothetical protein HNQ07_003453 [Deinococcus metalli]|uniref:PucR family transcriptional regulator n=1 Tax=Deinococcus metalli TaxID=1141878 RepID=A0A7W8KHL8_9DEIO|nr:helix-turn-helix domain-containing protein [Deinococcus metalli]MBB5377953.1 hypothetical protein [Deinococcus metalli]GHF54888.1 hypothetical protein GCM10017781_33820 [Deinococcus metalli]
MLRLNALRAELHLPAAEPDVLLDDLAAAGPLLPDVPEARWRAAAVRLMARSLRPHLADVAAVLADLRSALGAPDPEADLARWLADVTGGRATVRSSWGDVVAQAGEPGPVTVTQRLEFERRPVGTLHLEVEGGWEALGVLVADVLRLARLQSAAAGAARRRVGERQFEALLAGDASGLPGGQTTVLAALRLNRPLPRGARAREAHVQQLDVLCSVGEGYFHRRDLTCLTTVRGDVALWLWPGRAPQREARGLHTALLNATVLDFRLGVSQPQTGFGHVPGALRQAVQALDEVTQARGMASFEQLDPLHAVLDSGALHALSEQLRTRLTLADPDGRLEDTLRQYLAHAGTLGELAAGMNVHLNTLRYRLRRVEEALGGSLNEPAFLARVYLAFHARSGR